MLHALKNLETAGIQLTLEEGRHARLLGMLDHMIVRLTITTSSGTQTSDYTLFQCSRLPFLGVAYVSRANVVV